MRVTVTPDRHPSWGFTLSDGSHLNRLVRDGVAWILTKGDGLEGWYESADPRVEVMPDVPGVDGAYWPEEILLSSRTLAIRGQVIALGSRASSVGVASIRDRIAALVGEPVTVSIEDPAGVREVRGYVSGRTAPNRTNEKGFPFMIVVTCPDPLKYGQAVRYPAGTGPLVLENIGTGEVPFTVTTPNRVTSLQIEYAGNRFVWAGDADGLTVELADGRPLDAEGYQVGYLIDADPIRIPHGAHSVSVKASTPVTVLLRPGWR